jgi:26S proteasome regulatory subunit T5
MRSETLRLQHEQSVMKEKIRDNGEKIKQNKVLPYLVGNVVEVRPFTQKGAIICLYITARSSMSTLKSKKTAPTKTSTQCVKANVQ